MGHRGKVNSLTFNVLLLIAGFAVSFLILEIALRWLSPPSFFTPLLPLRPMMKIQLQVDLDGVSKDGRHTTNRWGLRGDEPPDPWKSYQTIVTIGGSTTQCYYLDDHKTWPYRLQEKMKSQIPQVWVGNGGLDGHSTRAHLIFMDEVIEKIRPNRVIFLTGTNDLGLSLSEERFLHGSPFDQARFRSPMSFQDFLLFKSRTLQLITLWKWIYFHDIPTVHQAAHQNFVPKPLAEPEAPLPDSLETFLPQLAEYESNLRSLISRARQMNVEPVFLTQPSLFEDNGYWKTIEAHLAWIPHLKRTLSAASYWKLLDRYNETLLKVCSEEQIRCLDLASEMPHDARYFYDSSHFTEEGAEFVADKVSEFLLKP